MHKTYVCSGVRLCGEVYERRVGKRSYVCACVCVSASIPPIYEYFNFV